MSATGLEFMLYTQPGCGGCFATERKIDRTGAKLTPINVREDIAGADRVRELGYPGTPVVEAYRPDGTLEHWHGHRPDKIDALVRAWETS